MDFSFIQSFLPLIVVFLFSVVIHEVAHGAVALAFGDPTAKVLGRLTLNPVKHLDPFGSVILPGMLFLLSAISGGQGPIFGWAKPVPYNPNNLRNRTWGPALVGLAGPGANITLALIFGLFIRFLAASQGTIYGLQITNYELLISFFATIIFVNLWLALFNLIPIPPLDGSKLLALFLPAIAQRLEYLFMRHGFLMLMVFFLLIFQIFLPVMFRLTIFIFYIIVGVSPGAL